jgi:hypothetical protein
MAWIKRNLYFLIGGAVAMVLLGLASWFLYSKWELNNQVLEKLNADYAELDRLNKQHPHPGSGSVNNIERAQKQQQILRDFIQNARPYFQRIAPIPEIQKLTDQGFSSALSRTIDQLRHDAAGASVILATNYSFSFEAQKQKVSFPAGSLRPLADQLGEVKTICDVLFQARINYLDGVRRVSVSSDDASGTQTDYLPEHSVTNNLAVLTPYEVAFRCFSSELAAVLAGFANSPYALLVKSINVEPAPSVGPEPRATPSYAIAPQPVPVPPGMASGATDSQGMAALLHSSFLPRGAGGLNPMTPPGYVPAPAPAPPGGRGGLPIVLDEKQLKIRLSLIVVKLAPRR